MIRLAVLVACALFSLGATPPCKPRLILFNHDYDVSEYEALPKEGWLAWDLETERPVLRRTKMLETGRQSGCSDEDIEVDVKGSQDDLDVAVRCIPGLKPGKARSVGIVNEFLTPNQPLTLHLGGQAYEIVVRTKRSDLADANVILRRGKQKQVLYSADGFADDAHFTVIWAGDLDGDGNLDLLVNLSRKYSLHPYRLLLSSHAKKGMLVGEAASLERSAC